MRRTFFGQTPEYARLPGLSAGSNQSLSPGDGAGARHSCNLVIFHYGMDWLAFPAVFCAGFLTAWGLNWLSLMPWRRAAGLHWTERARRLHTARVGVWYNTIFFPIIFLMTAGMIWPKDYFFIGLFGVMGAVGGILGNYPFTCETMKAIRFQDWIRQACAFWLLHLGGMVLVIGAALAMPRRFDWTVIGIGAATLGLRLWLDFGLAVALLRWLRVLAQPPERLQRIVSETALRMGIQVRRVWLLHSAHCYAAALLSSRELIFSDRLLELLPDDETAAVCAHELGHLSESRAVVARRIRLSLAFFPFIFLKPVFGLSSGWQVLAILFMLSWAIVMVNNGRLLARKMEVRADAIATENAVDAATYARGLERLYEANQIPAVMRSNKLAHPHLYDRLLSAGVTPGYNRPEPPDTNSWPMLFISITFGIVLVLFLQTKKLLS
jgi:Zn-dependent protease with chaperone function